MITKCKPSRSFVFQFKRCEIGSENLATYWFVTTQQRPNGTSLPLGSRHHDHNDNIRRVQGWNLSLPFAHLFSSSNATPTGKSYKEILRTRTWHISPNKNKARFLSKLNQPTQCTSVRRIPVAKSARKSSFIVSPPRISHTRE
jgi:hypothetical protein